MRYKTHYCGDLTAANAGEEVLLAGWVNRRRDHGRLIFIDLRDSRGLVQVVFNPSVAPEAHAVAEQVRPEYVLQVKGVVAARRPGTENRSLPTGEIEVQAGEATILNPSKTPPFYISEDSEVEDVLRLRYRYLDLRRAKMQERVQTRYRVIKYMRDFFFAKGFIEVETPILANPTPEGARDYLVPSRVSKGSFYALPQSPQQFKQLLMVAGYERYFQIARCFRDEDLRADRQPEFTQLDLEMSFVSSDDVLDIMEELYIGLSEAIRPDMKVRKPFARLTYDEAMRRFGTDKPDLRFEMELVDVSDLAPTCDFAVFRDVLAAGGQVRGFALPGGAALTRRDIDSLTRFVEEQGGKGLISVGLLGEGGIDTLGEEDIRSPMHRYLSMELIKGMAQRTGAKRGDLLIIVADQPAIASAALDALRRETAQRLGLIDPGVLAWCAITDFPLLTWDEEEKRWYAVHHPFTAPHPEDIPLLESDPGRARAQQYDIVCNGWEMAGGSIRIHQRDVQTQMFKLMGIGEEEAKRKFGHLLEAFEYGAPPHGGIAAGLDRNVAVLLGLDDIREVIAFPKTKTASDPMTGAPSPVPEEQLEELGLALRKPATVADEG
ncbi:MAG: aspartate--tRNA ligase [Dehalococcoidia bacterium]|nr:aspartate--tRNA ligase [Dehalococcoidia bacterium]